MEPSHTVKSKAELPCRSVSCRRQRAFGHHGHKVSLFCAGMLRGIVMMRKQAYWSLRIRRGLVIPVENDGGGGSDVRIITVGASTFFVALNLISIRPC